MKTKDRQIFASCQSAKKKLWNVKVTVIPTVVGALGTVSQRPGKENDGSDN